MTVLSKFVFGSHIFGIIFVNTAWVYKTKSVGVKVNDYDSFQRFCIRNGLEFALRKQVNLTGVREMYKMIMEGDLPEPKSADFYTFDKVTIRKR